MKKKIFTTLLLSLSLFLVISLNNQVLGNDREQLDQIEAEREEEFLNQLLLDIPIITDNPSHIITFIDPSEGAQGVQLEINDGGYELIRSPYNLPALRIGAHNLRFKFVDKFGSTQILEKDIIIIPRPPIINSPTFNDDSILISGTGLADSELVLILSSSKDITTKESDITKDGTWSIEIELTDMSEGLYTFTAYTRRYGYASNLAEPITFELGQSDNALLLERNGKKEIYFSFNEINLDNITLIISSNSDLIILIILTFTLGFIMSWLLNVIFRSSSEKKVIKDFENKINNNGSDNSEKKGMTLKEKLSKKDNKKEEKKEKKKEKTKKEKEEEKVVTKIDFLKDFQKFDPDDEKGKEKKNIDVKITSKS